MNDFPLRTLIRDPRCWRGSTLWVLLLLAAANLFVHRATGSLVRARQENLLAAGPDATPSNRNAPVPRFDESVGDDPGRCWPAIPDATKCRLVILTGMSQMYAINDRQPGDQTISEWMDDSLAPDGVRVFGLAGPNLCNEEALFLLVAAAADARTRPSAFIYAACFDKYRNVDLRSGYARLLQSRPEVAALWQRVAADVAQRYPQAARKMQQTCSAAQASAAPDDARFETRLRRWTGSVVPLVRERELINAFCQLRLFQLRNAVLRITPTSKRPVLQSRYELNRQFLGVAADFARSQGILFLTYVIPLNPRSENPYVPEEYAQFKHWLEAFSLERNIPYANLEDVVPADQWGLFMGGPDFKHFRGSGHRRTAEKLVEVFGPALRGVAPSPQEGRK